MPSVAFVSDDFSVVDGKPIPNGCTWYRCVLPGRELSARGWELGIGYPAVSPELGIGLADRAEDGTDRMLAGWDVIVLKLTMHRVVLEAMGIKACPSRIAVDVDDFHAGLHESNLATRSTDPFMNPDVNRGFYERIIRAAEFITVSTEFLANHYERRVRDVRLVRNAIDYERFPQADLSLPVIGWVGATPWRSRDIEQLVSWLPRFVRDTGVRVHHSGHIEGDPESFSKRAGVNASTSGMELIDDYPRMLQHFSIGLVPLNPIPFNEAKSCIKGLEYAASGIPFIASPTREYRLLADAGIGRLAESPDEWYDHALELLDDEIRYREGVRIRDAVRQFGIDKRGDEWVSALSG